MKPGASAERSPREPKNAGRLIATGDEVRAMLDIVEDPAKLEQLRRDPRTRRLLARKISSRAQWKVKGAVMNLALAQVQRPRLVLRRSGTRARSPRRQRVRSSSAASRDGPDEPDDEPPDVDHEPGRSTGRLGVVRLNRLDCEGAE